jgi:hypothetical protein
MMNKSFLLAALAVMLVATSEAFSSAFVGRQQQQNRLVSSSRTSSLQMAVVDIDSESAFDDKIKAAGKSLVVVDYSTTWCGPVSQEKERPSWKNSTQLAIIAPANIRRSVSLSLFAFYLSPTLTRAHYIV